MSESNAGTITALKANAEPLEHEVMRLRAMRDRMVALAEDESTSDAWAERIYAAMHGIL